MEDYFFSPFTSAFSLRKDSSVKCTYTHKHRLVVVWYQLLRFSLVLSFYFFFLCFCHAKRFLLCSHSSLCFSSTKFHNSWPPIFFYISWHTLKKHMLMKTGFFTLNCLRYWWRHHLGYISKILKPYFLEPDHTLKAAKGKKNKLPITANSFLQLTCIKQIEGAFNSSFLVNASTEMLWNEAVAKSRFDVLCLTACRMQ